MIKFKKVKKSVLLIKANQLTDIEIETINEILTNKAIDIKTLKKYFKFNITKKSKNNFEVNDIPYLPLYYAINDFYVTEEIYYEYNTINMKYGNNKLKR